MFFGSLSRRPRSLILVRGGAILLLLLAPAQLWPAPRQDVAADIVLSPADVALLDEIGQSAFRFFVEQADPRTGLVRDRARADGSPSEGKASIAASGFALSAWVIGVERGWASRDEALARVRAKLRFLVDEAPRQHGFFYHFMEMATGQRAWQCELSSIDSSLFFAGAIVAREYFADPEITTLVNRLLADIDWEWFRNGGRLVTLGWHDETGFSRYRWNKYSEHVLMSFLALGLSPRPLPAGYWRSWERTPVGRYKDYVYLQEPPLFVHQFPQAYLNLRDRRDAYVDFFRNTQLATYAQRDFSIDLRSEFPTWGENVWGLTASDSVNGYKAWGGPPRTLRFNALDGTIVPCAPAGSLPFVPRETLAVLHHLRTTYGDRIWKRYGFVDAFNPETGWVNPDVLGIDLGISIVQAENLRTGLVWRLFMQSEEARLGLAKAGFLSTARRLDAGQETRVRERARRAWTLLQAQPASPGLQLTALVAAVQLGLVSSADGLELARALVSGPVPANAEEAGQFAGALVIVRQLTPALAAEATLALDRLPWPTLTTRPELAAVSRLAVFFQIAAGTRPAQDWADLSRTTQLLGPVHVLAPADVAGALLPGLWLDERAILPGASSSQLAYASLIDPAVPPHPLLPALQFEHFPLESLARPEFVADTPTAAAACLITAANLLGPDLLREAFQRDPLVQAGRTAISDFTEAAFGPNTSVIAQHELAGTPPPPAPRSALAVSAALPRDHWQWQTVAGLEYKVSQADVRESDAPLTFRFAATWDNARLHLRIEVTDAPPGYALPPRRQQIVEVFIDPDGDGLTWAGTKDFQYTYRPDEDPVEHFHRVPAVGRITPTADGYIVEATISWAELGLVPAPGLEFGFSVAAVSEGTREWDPALKLNWSYQSSRPGEFQLGRLRLQ